ncbi:phage tail assembly protein [Rhodopila sp.]|uniref:phage tail assembly protein n=1 Tax=Rhodopila sp. TaxID=2480087 RepID=UPI003D0A7F90
MSDPITVTLSTPIQDINLATISTVTITPPTGRHLMKAGSVMRIITQEDSGETGIEINPAGMGKLIGVCANLPIRSVEMLSAADFMAISTAIMGFLAPTAATVTMS